MNVFRCEVAVVGGGLSGCSAAISLARSGVDVALFEAGQLPRHRVCGEFLSPESRATLRRLGAAEAVASAGGRSVKSAHFWCGGAGADFDLGEAPGLALSRFALDPLLWHVAAKTGTRGFLNAKVRHFERDGNGFGFEVRGQKWHAQAVVFAAGRGASPKSQNEGEPRFCGLKAHFSGADLPVGVVEMHLFHGGYCGLVRVEGEATNACLMVDYRHFSKSSPDAFWAQLLRQNATLRARFAGATRTTPWCATASVSFERFRPTGQPAGNAAERSLAERSLHETAGADPLDDHLLETGVLYAGDAAGYIHPLTGDGMAMALRAGELAATVARLQVQGLPEAEATRLYGAAWQREFAPRLQLAARLHPLALRPQWARPLLPLVQRLPALKRAWVCGTRGTV